MLKRFFVAVLLCVAAGRAAAIDYTDIWYIPAEAGWGVNVVQSDAFLFITFFIYGSDGKPTWFTGQVTRDNASGNYNGTLYSTMGTYYLLPWTGFTGGPAGTVSFQPLSPYTAKLIYTVNGIGMVTKTIQRQNLTPIALGGSYSGAETGAFSGCTTGNGPYGTFFNLRIDHLTTTSAAFKVDYAGYSCTYSATLQQRGQLYTVPATQAQCTDGNAPSLTIGELKATAQGVEGTFSALYGGTCRNDARFSAVIL